MDGPIRVLQEKIAYLERHVSGQDRAMLEYAEELAHLRREVLALRRLIATRGAEGPEPSPPPDERPPHY